MRSFKYQSNKDIPSDAKELLDNIVAGNLEAVKKLINQENINKSLEPNEGLTSIHVAIDHEKLDIVKYLVEQKADIEICYDVVDNALATALWAYNQYKTELGKKIALYIIAQGGITKNKKVLKRISELNHSDTTRVIVEKINILKETKKLEDRFKLELEVYKLIESAGEKEFASQYIKNVINDFAKNKKYKELSELFQKLLENIKDDKQKEAIIDSLEILKDLTLIDNSQNTSPQIVSKSIESKQQNYPSLESKSEINNEKSQTAFALCMAIANSYMAQIDNNKKSDKDKNYYDKAINYYIKACNIQQNAKLDVDSATVSFLKGIYGIYVEKVNLLEPKLMMTEYLLLAEAAKLGSVEAKNYLLYIAGSIFAGTFVIYDNPHLDIPQYLRDKFNKYTDETKLVIDAAKALYGINRKRNIFEAAQKLKTIELKNPNHESISLLAMFCDAHSQIALSSVDECIIKMSIDRCLSYYNEMITILKKNIDQKTGKSSDADRYIDIRYCAPLFQLLSLAKDNESRDSIYQQILKFIEVTADTQNSFHFKILMEALIETKLLEENPDRLKALVKVLQQLIAKHPTQKYLLDNIIKLQAVASSTDNKDLIFYVNKTIADSFYSLTFSEQKSDISEYTIKARHFYEAALKILPKCKNASAIAVTSLHKIYAKLMMKVDPAQAIISYQKCAEMNDISSALEGAKLAAQDEKTIDKAVSFYQTAVSIALKENNEANIKSLTEAIQNFTTRMDLSYLPKIKNSVSEMLSLLQKNETQKSEAKNISATKEVVSTGLYPNLNAAKPPISTTLYPHLEAKQAVIKIDPAILKRRDAHLENIAKGKELKQNKKKIKEHIRSCARQNDLSAVYKLFQFYTDPNPKEFSEKAYRAFNGPHIRRPLYLAAKIILLSLNKKNTQFIYDIAPSKLDKIIGEAQKYLSDWGNKKYSTLQKGTDEHSYCLFARWLQEVIQNTIEGFECEDPDLFLYRVLKVAPEKIELGDKHILADKQDIHINLTKAMKEGMDATKEWIKEKETLAANINNNDMICNQSLESVNNTMASAVVSKIDTQQSKIVVPGSLFPTFFAASAPLVKDISVTKTTARLSTPYVLPIEQALVYDVDVYPSLTGHTVGTQITTPVKVINNTQLMSHVSDGAVSTLAHKMYPSFDVASIASDPSVNVSVSNAVNTEMEPGATMPTLDQNNRSVTSSLAFISNKEVTKQPIADSKQDSIDNLDTQDLTLSALELHSLFQSKPATVVADQAQSIPMVKQDKKEAKTGEKKPLLGAKRKEKAMVFA